ncbi:hypothetical protein LLH03_09490 [bacterium]|nr:hypothetical protein [bacterium]
MRQGKVLWYTCPRGKLAEARSRCTVRQVLAACVLSLVTGAVTTCAATPDWVRFGDEVSEQAHQVVAPSTRVDKGGLEQPCRRIAAGGSLTFQLRCDPAEQNYLTVKLWGSDTQVATLFVFDGDKRLGAYGDAWPELDLGTGEAAFPGRFYYATYTLPRDMTQGKDHVTVKIGAVGSLSPYAPNPADRERPQTGLTRGIYRAYCHVDPWFEPGAEETQGVPPIVLHRLIPAGSPDLPAYQQQVDGAVTAMLRWQLYGAEWDALVARGDAPGSITGAMLRPVRLEKKTEQQWKDLAASRGGDGNAVAMNALTVYAAAYGAPWSRYYHDASLLERIAKGLDYACRAQSSIGGFVAKAWVGGPERKLAGSCLEGFGTSALGQCLVLVGPELAAGGFVDKACDDDGDPGSPEISRRQAWAQMLAKHRDFLAGPYGRGHATNQDMAQMGALWLANEAIRFLEPDKAWPRDRALSYVYSAAGIAKDVLGGYWVTRKGLCLEPWGTLGGGYCGNYGANCVRELCRLAAMTGDAQVRQKAVDAVGAFAPFVFPSTDDAGFACMRKEDIVNTRNTHWPCAINYGGDWIAAGAFHDPVALRSVQLYLEHGNLFGVLPESNAHFADSVTQAVLTMAQLQEALKQPLSACRFPMEEGLPDFAWVDEQAGTAAVKHGEARLYLALNWRRGFRDGKRDPEHAWVNNIARLHYTTPTIDRIATIAMESPYGFGKLYLCSYGPYWVAMNLSEDTGYTVRPPKGAATRAVDLISARRYDLPAEITVAPRSSVMLYTDH